MGAVRPVSIFGLDEEKEIILREMTIDLGFLPIFGCVGLRQADEAVSFRLSTTTFSLSSR